jgi:hypothetical protein
MILAVSRGAETGPGVRMSRFLLCAVLGLVIGLGAAGPVTGSAGEPTAVASKKKKCKKALHKCAPKRYHLSVTDTVSPGPQGSITENWSAEVDLVRVARSIGKVDYGSAGGKVNVSGGSFATECAEGGPATVRIEPQTIAVPAGPGYPFLGDFGVEFSLIGSDKNTYGGPLGTQGSGHSNLYVTAMSPCPEVGTYQTELTAPLAGMEGPGKVGKVLRGSDVDSRLFVHHSYHWTLTPGGKK